MGCWNKTCALTNLPIHAGERVIMFPLIEVVRSSGGRRCYNNWAWEYLPVPFYGEYDDYGFMEFDDGQQHKLDLLQKHYEDKLVRLEPYDEGKASEERDRKRAEDAGETYKEPGYVRSFIRYPELTDTPFKNNETMGNQMHGDVFGIADWYHKDKVRLLSHMMIREDAFKALSEGVYVSESEGTTSQSKEHILEAIEAYKAYVAAEDAKIRAKAEQADSKEAKHTILFTIHMNKMMDKHVNAFIEKELVEMREKRGYVVSYDWYALDRNILTFAFSGRSSGSETGYETRNVMEAVKESLTTDELLDCYALASMFSGLRKSFSPQGGEGSQESTNIFTELFGVAYMQAAYNIGNDDVADEEEEQFNKEFAEEYEPEEGEESTTANEYDILYRDLDIAKKEYKAAIKVLEAAARKVREIRSKI